MSFTTTATFRTISPHARLVAVLIEYNQQRVTLDGPQLEVIATRVRPHLDAAVAAVAEERDRRIIQYRYGLNDGQSHTLEQTSTQFEGIGRERVRQREAIALKQINNAITAANIDLVTSSRVASRRSKVPA